MEDPDADGDGREDAVTCKSIISGGVFHGKHSAEKSRVRGLRSLGWQMTKTALVTFTTPSATTEVDLVFLYSEPKPAQEENSLLKMAFGTAAAKTAAAAYLEGWRCRR